MYIDESNLKADDIFKIITLLAKRLSLIGELPIAAHVSSDVYAHMEYADSMTISGKDINIVPRGEFKPSTVYVVSEEDGPPYSDIPGRN